MPQTRPATGKNRVLQLIKGLALGKPICEIAFDWQRSPKTVEWVWSVAKAKYGFRCYQDVTRYAIKNKLIRI